MARNVGAMKGIRLPFGRDGEAEALQMLADDRGWTMEEMAYVCFTTGLDEQLEWYEDSHREAEEETDD